MRNTSSFFVYIYDLNGKPAKKIEPNLSSVIKHVRMGEATAKLLRNQHKIIFWLDSLFQLEMLK